ncbi:MAG: nucleoside-diphosphate kinase [Patescibacteria group bacterium]
MERSLIMLKPDAFERNLVKVIEDMVLSRNLCIINKKTIFLNRWDVLKLWPEFCTLWSWLTSQQYYLGYELQVWEVKGSDAINKIKELKISLRTIYCDPGEKIRLLIHAPDSIKDFEREKDIFFKLPSKLKEADF